MEIATSPAPSNEKPLRVAGEFINGELESAFRRDHLAEDCALSRVVLLVNAAGVLGFLWADLQLFGLHEPFPLLAGLRIFLLVLSWAAWRNLRSALSRQSPKQFDATLLALCVCMALAQVYVGSTRPITYTGHFLVHLVTVLLVYCAVPLRLRLQVIPALLMSAGIGVTMVLKPPSSGMTSAGIVWMLFGANVLGACVSRQLHTSKRRQFLAYTRELETRLNLEATLSELKTLRGIIPICAYCKHVRDDAGWEEIELYVARHLEANFSHGICPSCAKVHFGEFADLDPEGGGGS